MDMVGGQGRVGRWEGAMVNARGHGASEKYQLKIIGSATRSRKSLPLTGLYNFHGSPAALCKYCLFP